MGNNSPSHKLGSRTRGSKQFSDLASGSELLVSHIFYIGVAVGAEPSSCLPTVRFEVK